MHLQHPHRGGDMPRNAASGRERQPPVVRASEQDARRFSDARRFETFEMTDMSTAEETHKGHKGRAKS